MCWLQLTSLMYHLRPLLFCISTLKRICLLPGQLLPQIRWFHMKIFPIVDGKWGWNFKMKELMMEPERCLGMEKKTHTGKKIKLLEKEYISYYESYVPLSLTLYLYLCWPTYPVGFSSEDLALFSGLHISIWPFQTKKMHFLNKAICCVGVLSFYIILIHTYRSTLTFVALTVKSHIWKWSCWLKFWDSLCLLYQLFYDIYDANNQND